MKVYDLELRQKFVREEPLSALFLTNAAASVSYIRDAFEAYPGRESVWVIFVNAKKRATGRHLVSVGSMTGSSIGPREVFCAAILASAAAIIVVHNHPSGDPAPSRADKAAAWQLCGAGELIDIPVVDFIVVGEREADPAGKGYFSFWESGLIFGDGRCLRRSAELCRAALGGDTAATNGRGGQRRT